MIRNGERLHKRPGAAILTGHALGIHCRSGRLRYITRWIHRRRHARRPEIGWRTRRRAAHQHDELCDGRRFHPQRVARCTGHLRCRSLERAAGAHPCRRDERARRQRVHRCAGTRGRPGHGALRGRSGRTAAPHCAGALDRRDRHPAPHRQSGRRPAAGGGDTSTNDTVLLLANGSSGIDPSRDGALWKVFEEAVIEVARTLALAVVEDGEGATKQLQIHVVGATTEAHAREVGRAIARSSLVKTAIYGGDPNWGRVLAAAGAAGVPLISERITLEAATDGGWFTLATAGATALADAGCCVGCCAASAGAATRASISRV